MKQNLLLTITSLLSILFMTFRLSRLSFRNPPHKLTQKLTQATLLSFRRPRAKLEVPQLL
jgi:hypothetical protein